ncbi:MAG: hypothetical protein GEV10_08375 [Streptosporangiales bacterium]|nr:hypothetical protein [Streptosporangiales bacterium]
MQARLARPIVIAAGAACVVAAVIVAAVLLPGFTKPTPAGEFKGYTLTTTGGVAGVQHTVEVTADGTALFVDEEPVAGVLPRRSVERQRVLLADRRLAEEGGPRHPDSRCADGFQHTLRVDTLTVSTYACGRTEKTPVFDEIRSLTTKDGLRPLSDDRPEFRGLRAEVRRPRAGIDAAVAIDAAGHVTVDRADSPPERAQLDTGTEDALRLLFAEPLVAPSADSSRSCVPEDTSVYQVTPTGGPTTTVSPCERMTDLRWVARLRILDNAIGA